MLPARRLSAWLPSLAGATLIVLASRSTDWALAFAILPGALLLMGGLRSLINPDLRAPQHAALGSLLGVLLALPLGLAGGATLGLTALALSVVAFVSCGILGIVLDPKIDDVPAPAPSITYGAFVALDDTFLSVMSTITPPPGSNELRDAARESEAAFALFTERGWIENPASFHQTPPAFEHIESSRTQVRGLELEHIRVESGYDPDAAIPGRERWLAHRENRTSHAWIARHQGPGPWLVCVHGFGMGNPQQDIPAFRAKQFFERGLNIALIALPMHGPRALGNFSGAKFMSVSPLDFLHGETQAIWDLRRLIGWIRTQDATRIGLHGISLGAYTSSLLAGIQDGLDCVIAGVPPADIIATTLHFASSYDRRMAIAAGVDYARDTAVHRVVSPLAVSPLLEPDRRFIYAATGDRLVPIEQVRALWLHWDRPRINWCKGGHMSALYQSEQRALLEEAVAATLVSPSPHVALG